MPTKKIDGVIEAVRYTSDGKIDIVRAYERRGAVWSDHLILSRAELAERLGRGKKFFTGSRRTLLGSSLQAKESVRFQNNYIRSGIQSENQDRLDGVPTF